MSYMMSPEAHTVRSTPNYPPTPQYRTSASVMGAGVSPSYHATVSSIMSSNRYNASPSASHRHAHTGTHAQQQHYEYQQQFPQQYQQYQGQYQQSSSQHILSERVVEHEVRVPKKIVREDIVEKVIVIPEKVMHEEVIEDIQYIREKIIEVAKPIYQERIVEVPEIEYIERIVEVPEIIYQEKIREVPRVEIQERIVEIPKIITQERVVEVPEIEYREYPVEKILEIPEVHEQVVLKQIPVPQYIDKPVPEYVTYEVEQEVIRNIPLPVEVVTTLNLKVPQLKPRYTRQDVPLYVPRFIEVAMPAELMTPAAIAEAENYAQQVAIVASQNAASLCEVERLAGTLKDLDGYYSGMMSGVGEDPCAHFSSAWNSGRFQLTPFREIPTTQRPIACRSSTVESSNGRDPKVFTRDASREPVINSEVKAVELRCDEIVNERIVSSSTQVTTITKTVVETTVVDEECSADGSKQETTEDTQEAQEAHEGDLDDEDDNESIASNNL